MAQLEAKKVLKIGLLPIKDFAKSLGISSVAVLYCVRQGMVDSFTLGDRTYVCDTAYTRQYKPNGSPRRVKPKKAVRKRSKVPNKSSRMDAFE